MAHGSVGLAVAVAVAEVVVFVSLQAILEQLAREAEANAVTAEDFMAVGLRTNDSLLPTISTA
ncbi:hypothetical protein PC116_g33477 [Phytophthora cactorum]|nr:hypothetical protein PC116_g33477 [Phytophthora cactorum]